MKIIGNRNHISRQNDTEFVEIKRNLAGSLQRLRKRKIVFAEEALRLIEKMELIKSFPEELFQII
jgi:hypothetical protein